MIFDLVFVSGLPNGVKYFYSTNALVQLDNATLARNFIDAIANDWATKKSKTAQEAMEAVRNRDLQREAKRKQQLYNAGKNNYRRQGGYQEQLPDWAKDSMRRRNKHRLP